MKHSYPHRRYVFMAFLLSFLHLKQFAQCPSYGPEPASSLIPTCSSQTTITNGVGPGMYIFYSGFIPNTWYGFSLGNEPLTLLCGDANFTDSNQTVLGVWTTILSTTAYMYAPPNT